MDVCLMSEISHYTINVNFSTGEFMSLVAYNRYVTILSEYLKQTNNNPNNTNVTLQLDPFSYTITIVAYNSEGMSSQPTSKYFGMNIHTCIATNVLYLVVSFVRIISIYHNLPVSSHNLYSSYP